MDVRTSIIQRHGTHPRSLPHVSDRGVVVLIGPTSAPRDPHNGDADNRKEYFANGVPPEGTGARHRRTARRGWRAKAKGPTTCAPPTRRSRSLLRQGPVRPCRQLSFSEHSATRFFPVDGRRIVARWHDHAPRDGCAKEKGPIAWAFSTGCSWPLLHQGDVDLG